MVNSAHSLYFLFIGIILGMGAAIPIGPVNLEIIRRNLLFGTSYGIVLGLGACSADVTYLFLLSMGALSMLQHPNILKAFGFGGSLILAWFAISTFRNASFTLDKKAPNPSLIRYSFEGYIITLLNPFTILFWASISSQISMVAISHNLAALLLTGAGVIVGTVAWVLFLNLGLHFTRHKLTSRVMTLLNYLGGLILLGFAFMGFLKALG